MRALIIGTGYVGLPLGAKLVRRGHEVFGLRRNRDAAGELEAAGIRPIFADITNPEELAELPREFDWVVNCVASGGGGVEDYKRVYLEGMQNIVAWLAPTGRPALRSFTAEGTRDAGAPRVVYTSSTSVYGQSDGSEVDEASATEPVADTARVLLKAERLLMDAARLRTFSALVLRVAGIYGPGRGYWFKQFVNGEARLDVKGERVLNMIHRDDVVGCIIAALERGKPGNVYNAADDEPVSQSELFSWLANYLHKPMPASAPDNHETARRRGATSKRVLNRKLKAELGYCFKYPTFREGFVALHERK